MTTYPDPLYELVGVSDQPEEVRIEYRLDRLVSELDEACSWAKSGQVDEYTAGQILTRAQLIRSFLMARDEPKLRIVK